MKFATINLWCLVLVLSLPAAPAFCLTVSGTVEDSASVPIDGLRVEIYDEDTFLDDRIDVVYTAGGGAYSSSAPESGDDLYVTVKWQLDLERGVDGPLLRILDLGAGQPLVVSTTYTEKSHPAEPLEDIETSQTIDVTMDQPQPGSLGALHAQVKRYFEFIELELLVGGFTGWEMDYDVPVHILTDTAARQSSGEIYIPAASFNGTGSAKLQIDVFHEATHLLHYRHNGDASVPALDGCQVHSVNTEEDTGCALREGYAQYVAQLIAEEDGLMSPFSRAYRDDGAELGYPPKSLWRGDEGGFPNHSPGHTGYNSGFGLYESGEIVEGAFSGVLFTLHGLFGFATSFEVLHDDDPESAFELLEGLVDRAGAGTPQANSFYAAFQSHGLVYSRALFAEDPFDAPEPPDAAPAQPGNLKEIEGLIFLRGEMAARVRTAEPFRHLGITDEVDVEEVRVYYGPALDGESDPLPTSGFVGPVAIGLFNDEIQIDTRTFGGASGDGAWDLLVAGENEDGFLDDFAPDWTGDGVAARNSNERYLKSIGAWFDDDGLASSVKDGKVMVDNTAPVLSSTKP